MILNISNDSTHIYIEYQVVTNDKTWYLIYWVPLINIFVWNSTSSLKVCGTGFSVFIIKILFFNVSDGCLVLFVIEKGLIPAQWWARSFSGAQSRDKWSIFEQYFSSTSLLDIHQRLLMDPQSLPHVIELYLGLSYEYLNLLSLLTIIFCEL